MTYQEASNEIKNNPSKVVAHMTTLTAVNGGIALIYHTTRVITWYKNGTIQLQHGGYLSPTTKRRINAYIPFGSIIQRDGLWCFVYKDITVSFSDKMHIRIEKDKNGIL
ncbi:MAG TPA: hypothetical protein ENI76_06335 [Ignavibacteria bacterium]|nr:hypothetical protein [Ignavibacteria bacterium]